MKPWPNNDDVWWCPDRRLLLVPKGSAAWHRINDDRRPGVQEGEGGVSRDIIIDREPDADGNRGVWVRKGSEIDRILEAERRPGESPDDVLNRLLLEGMACQLARLTPEKRAEFDA